MLCQYCNHDDTRVLDSRVSENFVRRRRECADCKRRFTTYERAENMELIVVKKDARREVFNRTKLIRGLARACEKRPVKLEDIERVADEIERELRSSETDEVHANDVGKIVMTKLKELDKIAYIRFASVYREFTDVGQFKSELKKLLN